MLIPPTAIPIAKPSAERLCLMFLIGYSPDIIVFYIFFVIILLIPMLLAFWLFGFLAFWLFGFLKDTGTK